MIFDRFGIRVLGPVLAIFQPFLGGSGLGHPKMGTFTPGPRLSCGERLVARGRASHLVPRLVDDQLWVN